jgi:hypothetical protein
MNILKHFKKYLKLINWFSIFVKLFPQVKSSSKNKFIFKLIQIELILKTKQKIFLNIELLHISCFKYFSFINDTLNIKKDAYCF